VKSLWIGMAGFVGAVSRYHVEGWVSRHTRSDFPVGTLAVNLSGCLLLGFVITLFAERLVPSPHLRAAVTIGFLGAYTTFSTFAYETLRLGDDGAPARAVLYAVASVGLGVLAAWMGTVLAKAV